jgi:N-methylhydantoinase A
MPIAPGVTSALGLLVADLRHDYVRTVLKRADEVSPGQLSERYSEMESEAADQMRREGVADGATLLRVADIRYLGQGFELDVPVDGGELTAPKVSEAIDRFHDAHERTYGYANPGDRVEIVNLRLTAIAALPRPKMAASPLAGKAGPEAALRGDRRVYFDGRPVTASIYDRTALTPGDSIEGPSIVEQLDSTTVVWPGQTAHVDAFGNLVLEIVQP